MQIEDVYSQYNIGKALLNTLIRLLRCNSDGAAGNTGFFACNQYLLDQGVLGGFDLESTNPALKNQMLIAVTEVNSKEEIDLLVNLLRTNCPGLANVITKTPIVRNNQVVLVSFITN